MTIRKNFLFDEKIAKYLEDIANNESATQTQVIKNMIEVKYQEIRKKEKIEAFKSLTMFPAGSLVGKSIQSIKTEMGSGI